MSEESQQLVASDGGIQTVVPQSTAVSPQIVYLDFDGAATSYNGELLTINDVVVEDSGFDSESITLIVIALNDHFGDDVVFTAELPQTDEYSTIYVGVTSAFEEYGDFLGIAETLDSGNQNHNDNAFVLLNSTASTELVTSVIAHETEHIVGELTHGSGALNAYAEENISIVYINADYHNLLYDHIYNHARLDADILDIIDPGLVLNGIAPISRCSECASYPVKVINATNFLFSAGYNVNGINIVNGAKMFVSSGGTATNIGNGSGAVTEVFSGGKLVNFTVAQGGLLIMHNNAAISGFMNLNGMVSAESNAIVDFSVNMLTDSSSVLVNGLDALSSVDQFTCTVKADQAPGNYRLASNASLSKTITLKTTNNVEIGELSINKTLLFDGKYYSLFVQNTDLTLSVIDNVVEEIPDEVYEWLAHTIAYMNLSIGAKVSHNGFYFKVYDVVHDAASGLDALCVIREDEKGNSLDEGVMLLRGTEGRIADIMSDLNANSIGANQVAAGLPTLQSWISELNQLGIEKIDFTGHSLGGALAQQFASRLGGRNLITFQSPGVNMVDLGAQAITGRVKHYVNRGDIVSLAGFSYVQGDYSLSLLSSLRFPAVNIRTLFSAISFLADMHTNNALAISNNYLDGTSNELSSGSFGYIARKNNEDNYIFDISYAKLALVMSLGNIKVANLFTSRESVEGVRGIVAQIIDILSNGAVESGKSVTFVVEAGVVALAATIISGGKVVGIAGKGIVKYLISQSVWSFKNEVPLFEPSNLGDPDIYEVYLDNDRNPDLLFNCATQKFLPIVSQLAYTGIIQQMNMAGGGLFTVSTRSPFVARSGDDDDAWNCLLLPNFSLSERFAIASIVSSNNVALNAADVIKNDKLMILDNTAVSYNINYSIDQTITSETGLFFLPPEITKQTDDAVFYLCDIDASGTSFTVHVSTNTGNYTENISMMETDVAGIFTGTVSLSQIQFTEFDDLLIFQYDDASNVAGVSESVISTIELRDYLDYRFFKQMKKTGYELSWRSVSELEEYKIEFSYNGFDTILEKQISLNKIDVFSSMPSLSWRITTTEEDVYSEEKLVNENALDVQSINWQAETNGSFDFFIAYTSGIWTDEYRARHQGVLGEWDGTSERVCLEGFNRFNDFYAGSADANMLCLTDDENGDALFVDDIYSAFPEGLDAQARIAKINEIRAGAGNDLIDLTSQRFEYVGDGVTVKGGLGDDVVWANRGDNWLFGDAGNDRLVGANGNDVIVGGCGDDSLHGGGGEDIFAFGGDWGNDVVEQLADGKITLWFDEGASAYWDAANLTYFDGANRVQVSGVTAENVTLKFGDDGSEQYAKLLESGAFDEFSSERIFENKNTRGMLA